MNARVAAALVRLYPRAWRTRYGEELAVLLADHPSTPRAIANVIGSALCERLIAVSMFLRADMDQRQRSLVLMAYAYLAAVAAGVNFYWTVADTPMAIAMHGHSLLFVSWRVVGVGSIVPLPSPGDSRAASLSGCSPAGAFRVARFDGRRQGRIPAR